MEILNSFFNAYQGQILGSFLLFTWLLFIWNSKRTKNTVDDKIVSVIEKIAPFAFRAFFKTEVIGVEGKLTSGQKAQKAIVDFNKLYSAVNKKNPDLKDQALAKQLFETAAVAIKMNPEFKKGLVNVVKKTKN